jgi:hypothetical protein
MKGGLFHAMGSPPVLRCASINPQPIGGERMTTHKGFLTHGYDGGTVGGRSGRVKAAMPASRCRLG